MVSVYKQHGRDFSVTPRQDVVVKTHTPWKRIKHTQHTRNERDTHTTHEKRKEKQTHRKQGSMHLSNATPGPCLDSNGEWEPLDSFFDDLVPLSADNKYVQPLSADNKYVQKTGEVASPQENKMHPLYVMDSKGCLQAIQKESHGKRGGKRHRCVSVDSLFQSEPHMEIHNDYMDCILLFKHSLLYDNDLYYAQRYVPKVAYAANRNAPRHTAEKEIPNGFKIDIEKLHRDFSLDLNGFYEECNLLFGMYGDKSRSNHIRLLMLLFFYRVIENSGELITQRGLPEKIRTFYTEYCACIVEYANNDSIKYGKPMRKTSSLKYLNACITACNLYRRCYDLRNQARCIGCEDISICKMAGHDEALKTYDYK